ncbi:MAG TPA: hypothetical protein VHV51_03735 [Polyangiaceae bacterium]|jgi:hypothetical protein|nr:hypothetical protein [Polyangiaceae bacterium]
MNFFGVLLRGAIVVAGVALNALGGCKAHAGEPQAASSAAPSASALAPPSASAATAQAKPWYSGAFEGTYQAALAPVDVQVGAVREWVKDDGKAASGPGKLDLKIADDGIVDGTGEGGLGASHAHGKVEDDTLRVVLSPDDASTGLHGVLVATKNGDGFRGSIEASSGDSLVVRKAPIELKKQPN